MGYTGKIHLYTTAVILANVFYILQKKIGAEKSKELLKKLRRVLKVLPVTEKNVDDALRSRFSDFEDGLQYFSAKENNIPVLITRNVRDYAERDLVVQTAEEYLKSKPEE